MRHEDVSVNHLGKWREVINEFVVEELLRMWLLEVIVIIGPEDHKGGGSWELGWIGHIKTEIRYKYRKIGQHIK